MPQDALDDVLTLLDIEPIEVNIFRGVQPDEDRQRVFGGQVAGQALVAAARTVDDGVSVHSLHSYFLRPGDPSIPILYEVDRIRDGRSFVTRRVVAIQHGRAIFNLQASFHTDEDGFDHQAQMPDVPDPDELPSRAQLMEENPEAFPTMWRDRPRPVDMRYVTELPYRFKEGREPTQLVWFRADGTLPDDPVKHTCLLAYMSDMMGESQLHADNSTSDQRHFVMLEGEGVVNDVVAVSLYGLLLGGLTMPMGDMQPGFVWHAMTTLAVGVISGLAAGITAKVCIRIAPTGAPAMAIGFAFSLLAYLCCQYVVLGSGAVAVVTATMVSTGPGAAKDLEHAALVHGLDWATRVILFVAAGATVTVFMFSDQWLAMLIAVIATIAARMFVVVGGLQLFNRLLPKMQRVPARQQVRLAASGQRGAVVLALALALPLDFSSWYTVQAMAYAVVIFSALTVPFYSRGSFEPTR